MRDPPTHLHFPSPPFSPFYTPPSVSASSSPSLSPSHSPLLLSLFSLARSSPSAAQLYSTGMEMGLSRPGVRRRIRRCLIDGCSHTHARTHTQSLRRWRWRSHRRWECSPCVTMKTPPPGSGRTRSSTVWCRPPPGGTDPDTPGPGRSWATPPYRHGRGFLTEGHRLAEPPFRLFVEERQKCC